jgi:hypothetical protein
MSILPPPRLPHPSSVVIQEQPLAAMAIGIFCGDVLVGIEQLVDERASWCLHYNRLANELRTGLTARPIAVEIGGDA